MKRLVEKNDERPEEIGHRVFGGHGERHAADAETVYEMLWEIAATEDWEPYLDEALEFAGG